MSSPNRSNAHLLSEPVGARVRALRKRARLTQAGLLQKWAVTLEDAPTQGWISQIESGALTLNESRAVALAQVLDLNDSDRALLLETSGQAHSPDVVGYMDWQAVRYWVGNYFREQTKGEEESRAQGVLNLLGEALREDDDFFTLHKSAVGRVENLTDRTEAHRWLLLVEAAFMEPFAPYEPMKRNWRESRVPMLVRLAERMEISLEESAQKLIESSRHPTVPQLGQDARALFRPLKTYTLDKEIKQLDLGAHSVFRAPLIGQSSDPEASLLAGASLIGHLGWNFAGGIFLTTQLDAAGKAAVGPGVLMPAVSHRRLLGAANATTPSARKGYLQQAEAFSYPDFLLSLGRAQVSQELAKLLCLIQLRTLKGGELDFTDVIPGLNFDLSASRLDENRLRIDEAHQARLSIDYRSSPGCKELKSISSAFRLYLDRFPK